MFMPKDKVTNTIYAKPIIIMIINKPNGFYFQKRWWPTDILILEIVYSSSMLNTLHRHVTQFYLLGGDINFPEIPAEYFDRILLDVPCSALGQRPSIKNSMTLNSLKSYPGYQRKFIRKVLFKKYLILYIAVFLFIIFYFLHSLLNKCNITYPYHQPIIDHPTCVINFYIPN